MFFVLQVVTGLEQRLRDDISHLLPPELRVHVPLRVLEVRKSGVKGLRETPLFPGYLFIEGQDIPSSVMHDLRTLTGFVRCLPANDRIQPLGKRDEELLYHLLQFGERIGLSTVRFNPDQRIVVERGPLKGLEGRIIKVDKRKGRARVLFDLYDRSFPVDLGFETLTGPDPKEMQSHGTGT